MPARMALRLVPGSPTIATSRRSVSARRSRYPSSLGHLDEFGLDGHADDPAGVPSEFENTRRVRHDCRERHPVSRRVSWPVWVGFDPATLELVFQQLLEPRPGLEASVHIVRLWPGPPYALAWRAPHPSRNRWYSAPPLRWARVACHELELGSVPARLCQASPASMRCARDAGVRGLPLRRWRSGRSQRLIVAGSRPTSRAISRFGTRSACSVLAHDPAEDEDRAAIPPR